MEEWSISNEGESDIFRRKWEVNLIFYIQMYCPEEKKQRYYDAIRPTQAWLDLFEIPREVNFLN